MQKDMLREIDNFAVLKSYGIDTNLVRGSSLVEEVKINGSGRMQDGDNLN